VRSLGETVRSLGETVRSLGETVRSLGETVRSLGETVTLLTGLTPHPHSFLSVFLNILSLLKREKNYLI
jgi:hypothetical protein